MWQPSYASWHPVILPQPLPEFECKLCPGLKKTRLFAMRELIDHLHGKYVLVECLLKVKRLPL